MTFEFRKMHPDEAEQAVAMESICFPPHEQNPAEAVRAAVREANDTTICAIDPATGKLAGMIMGLATDDEHFRDDFLSTPALHNPGGKNVMITGVEVLPEYRRQGLASEMMRRYLSAEKAKGRACAVLTCLDDKVAMYEKMGYTDFGLSASVWGGEQWHEMRQELN